MHENHFAAMPTALYGCVLLMAAIAFFSPWVSQACYVAVALLWLVPDRRIESALSNHGR